jgi:hypothetical protein
MKLKTKTRAGGVQMNHNAQRMIVKTSVRAGGMSLNHNSRSWRP